VNHLSPSDSDSMLPQELRLRSPGLESDALAARNCPRLQVHPLPKTHNAPLYDMIFATDHEVGDKIMALVYRAAAARFPQMRRDPRS
jgi:hypothetical protein